MSWKLSFKFIIAHFLVPSIICFFFFALTTKWISFGSKTITRALSQIGLPSASAPVKVCQVFHAPLHPRPPHPSSTPPHPRQLPRLMEMLAAYRCWPVVLLFEMCSLYFSLEGNGDRLISPDAHSPGKKDKKKKEREEAEEVRSFTEHLPPELKPTLEKNCPFQEFVKSGIKSAHQEVLGVREGRQEIYRRVNITKYKYLLGFENSTTLTCCLKGKMHEDILVF